MDNVNGRCYSSVIECEETVYTKDTVDFFTFQFKLYWSVLRWNGYLKTQSIQNCLRFLRIIVKQGEDCYVGCY